MEIANSIPKAFISYSWDDEEHKGWVKNLAGQLRKDGVETILDQWHVRAGDQLPAFMEKAVRENDFVLIVCTPKYKVKSENRSGGVGYEGDVIQAEVFTKHNHRKFIPLLRRGSWNDALPSQLSGKFSFDFRDYPESTKTYSELLDTLHDECEAPPPLGAKPVRSSASAPPSFRDEPPIPKLHNKAARAVRLRKFLVEHGTSDDLLSGYWQLFKWPVPENTKSIKGMKVRGDLALYAPALDNIRYEGIMTMIANRPGAWEHQKSEAAEPPFKAWYEVDFVWHSNSFHGTSRMIGKKYLDPSVERIHKKSGEPHYVHTGRFNDCSLVSVRGVQELRGKFETTSSSGEIDFVFSSRLPWSEASDKIILEIPFTLSSRRSIAELIN